MAETSAAELVRAYFRAFETADRPTMEALLDVAFRFTSPFDDRIDRAAWFARCWPFAGSFRFRTDMTIFSAGAEAVVLYETEGKPGGTFRNAERFRVADGRIVAIEVYFGFLPQPIIDAAMAAG